MERGKTTQEEKEQKSYGEKVDIEELLPKDKQRILTNLYTKLAFGMKWVFVQEFDNFYFWFA